MPKRDELYNQSENGREDASNPVASDAAKGVARCPAKPFPAERAPGATSDSRSTVGELADMSGVSKLHGVGNL